MVKIMKDEDKEKVGRDIIEFLNNHDFNRLEAYEILNHTLNMVYTAKELKD